MPDRVRGFRTLGQPVARSSARNGKDRVAARQPRERIPAESIFSRRFWLLGVDVTGIMGIIIACTSTVRCEWTTTSLEAACH
jgi:hypothetical protein